MKQPRTRRRRHRRPARSASFGKYTDLPTYLAESGESESSLARQVDTSQPTIWRIVNGINLPRTDLALRITAYTGIPLDSFLKVYLSRNRRRKVGKVA